MSAGILPGEGRRPPLIEGGKMEEKNETYQGEETTIEIPHFTWRCYLFGIGSMIVLNVAKPPNFFWRWMQYLCFGNRWEKIRE